MEAATQELQMAGPSEPLAFGQKPENKSRPIFAQVSFLYGQVINIIIIIYLNCKCVSTR
jgi:hypothetical protein